MGLKNIVKNLYRPRMSHTYSPVLLVTEGSFFAPGRE